MMKKIVKKPFQCILKTAILIVLFPLSCGKREAVNESEVDSKNQIKQMTKDTTPKIELKNAVEKQDDNTLHTNTWTETLNTEMPDYLYKLDSAALRSDASFAEELGLAAANYYEKKPFDFLKYLATHPNSKLEERFTNELSASISVYEGGERVEELNQVIARLYSEISRTDIDTIGKIYLRTKMIKKIDPRKFD
jgi:hypothetical protein